MEPKPKSQSAQQPFENNAKSKLKETALDIGLAALTALATGIAMAAGGHIYASTARRFGGKPAEVVPLRKVT